MNEVAKFGTTFTKHMLTMKFDSNKGGWQEPQINPFGNLTIHPAAKALNYGCQVGKIITNNEVGCILRLVTAPALPDYSLPFTGVQYTFEGMKAYRGDDGKIRLFRPLLNLHRLNRSNELACLPQIDVQLLLKHIAKLVDIDKDFLPLIKDGGFYIRPVVISTDGDLGMDAGRTALLYVILSPVGPYFGSGFQPIRLAAVSKFVRAWPGGTGHLKLGGNYPIVIYVMDQIKKQGCNTALWLFGQDENITEAGVMNFFMFYINDKGEKELKTPPLDTTILPGVTRTSILELSREWNEFNVVEGPVTFKELRYLLHNKKVLEMMGVGTACVICPIAEILYEEEIIKVPTMEQHNPLYKRFYQALGDIHYGRISHPWAYVVDSKH